MEMVFYSVTNERIPLMDERMAILREAGDVLHEVCFANEKKTPDGHLLNCIGFW